MIRIISTALVFAAVVYFSAATAVEAQSLLQINESIGGGVGRQYGYLDEAVGARLMVASRLTWLVQASGNHIFTSQQTVNPLNPDGNASTAHNFARFTTGLEAALPEHVTLGATASKDSFDSSANLWGASVAWWPTLYSDHPLQLSGGVSRDDRTHVWSGDGTAMLGLGQRSGISWFGVVAGDVYEGGLLGGTVGRLGAGFRGTHVRSGWSATAIAGGGYYGPYGDFSISHSFAL